MPARTLTVFLGLVLALAGCRKSAPTPREELDRKFQQMMSGAILEGRSSRLDSERIGGTEKYFIDRATRLAGDTWLLQARFRYGTRELPIPVPVSVLWAGDTPVLTLNEVPVPGMGSYSARVVLHGDQYAGTWRGKKGADTSSAASSGSPDLRDVRWDLMRFAAVLAPACLVLAGAGYFFAKPKPNPELTRVYAALEREAEVDDDAADAALIRELAETKDLSSAQAASLFTAAGRRYMRRKLDLADAERAVAAGLASPDSLEPLRKEMERARRVCDLADSLGRRKRQLTLFARAESDYMYFSRRGGLVDRFTGAPEFSDADLKDLEKAFRANFGKDLPVSAHGDTSAHRAMGFDHSGRVDVAVSPENSEGLWLRRYLTGKNVSFFAFRSAVRGQATGAHIHIGAGSRRLWASRQARLAP